MRPQDILEIVRSQVGNRWQSEEWPHGVQLDRCVLNPPQRRRFQSPTNAEEWCELWVVLEEDPIDRSGYCIAMDEATGRFGLGTTTRDGDQVFLGFYGDFVETLEAM